MKINFVLLLIFLLCGPAFCLGEAARYVSLAPSTTEILFALGLDEEIAGVSSLCDYPPRARTKQIVGTFSQPNIEKIVSLKPDIVFCAGFEQAPAVKKLKQVGIKVYMSEPRSIEELFESISRIGSFTGRQAQAQALIETMREKIKIVRAQAALVPPQERPDVFIEYWSNPLMTAGPGSFIDELISLAGGKNIAYDTRRPYCNFSPEEVIKRDPDCIILAYMINGDAAGVLKQRLGWSRIKAVKNNRVFGDIDPNILLRAGPRVTEGLVELHKRFYAGTEKDEN